jgi:hypothetical protein
LKDVPWWNNLCENFKRTPTMKHPCLFVKKARPKELEGDDLNVEVIVLAMLSQGGKTTKQLANNQHMKEEQRLGKVHEVVLKAQVVATFEMPTTMRAKVETLQEHMTLQLFIMLMDLLVFDPKAKEKLQLQHLKELAKFK